MKNVIMTLALLSAAANVFAKSECDIKILDKPDKYKIQSQTTIKAKGEDFDAIRNWAEDRYKGLAEKIEFSCVDNGVSMHLIIIEDFKQGWLPQFPVKFGSK